MVTRIVFLVYWPITDWEANRWGFEYLRSQGFSLQVYDLSRLLNGKALQRCPVANTLVADWIFSIDSYAVLEEKVRIVAAETMFVDYIMGLAPVDFTTERVYRILGKNKARYCVISAGALPEVSTSATPGGFFRQLWHDILLATNPHILLNFFAKKIIVPLTTIAGLYPTPDLIFGGASERLDRYRIRYRMAPASVIPIHSIDHDMYLRYKSESDSLAPDGTCVFLDEAATHHSDFALLNIRPLEARPYYESMNRFFERIESDTGLKVVIAAHPRSTYEQSGDVFNGRKIIKGQSVALVARSSLVVTHASTSVSFAVLFGKPLILAKTAGIAANNHYSLLVDTMAFSLGVTPLQVEKGDPIYLPTDFSPEVYRDYLYKYVKSPGVDDLTVWEIFAREMSRYVCDEPSTALSAHV